VTLAGGAAVGALARYLSPEGTQPLRRADIEELLTAGYAEALELEAERLRIAECLEEAIARIEEPRGIREIALRRAELGIVTERLAALRDRLEEAGRRFGALAAEPPPAAPAAVRPQRA